MCFGGGKKKPTPPATKTTEKPKEPEPTPAPTKQPETSPPAESAKPQEPQEGTKTTEDATAKPVGEAPKPAPEQGSLTTDNQPPPADTTVNPPPADKAPEKVEIKVEKVEATEHDGGTIHISTTVKHTSSEGIFQHNSNSSSGSAPKSNPPKKNPNADPKKRSKKNEYGDDSDTENEDYDTLFNGALKDVTQECKDLIVAARLRTAECEQNLDILKNCLRFEIRKPSSSSTKAKAQVVRSNSAILKAKGYDEKELAALFRQEDPKKTFSSLYKIGGGGFGEVFTAKNKETNKKVAIKVMKRNFTESMDMIANEIKILKSCDHKNIVAYMGTWYWKDKIWLVMEYCSGGSLKQLISEVNLTEAQVAHIAREVLEGLEYLHAQNRIHRDVKSDNILLNINGDVKLADLGLAAEVEDNSETVHSSMVGSRNWMAPEIIRRLPYNYKVDLWAFGALMMELTDGNPPYTFCHPLKTLFRIATRGALPLKAGKWSEELRDMVSKCFIMDAHERWSATQLLQHPFLKNACPKKQLIQSIELVFLGNSLRLNGF